MQLNVCHPEIKMKEIKGTGNLFYPFINNDFDQIYKSLLTLEIFYINIILYITI